MRTSMAGTWLLGIVLVFMTVFIAYISISINYNHAYQLKTNMVQIIEEYQGLNDKSIQKINRLMMGESYGAKGSCKTDFKATTTSSGGDSSKVQYQTEFIGTIGVNGTSTTPKSDETYLTGKYNYCVYLEKKYVKKKDSSGNYVPTDIEYYYSVEVFLKFNLPVLGDLYDFRIVGETNPIKYPYDNRFGV